MKNCNKKNNKFKIILPYVLLLIMMLLFIPVSTYNTSYRYDRKMVSIFEYILNNKCSDCSLYYIYWNYYIQNIILLLIIYKLSQLTFYIILKKQFKIYLKVILSILIIVPLCFLVIMYLSSFLEEKHISLDKPILYIYPEKDIKVDVSFEKPDLLTTTYPKYNNVWSVNVKPNGDVYDSNGKYYYGLYWEEKGSIKVDFNEGFYVTKDSAIKFLEDKLDYIGLTRRETNEFVMYWLPIIEKNGKSLIYFELTEERQDYNRLIIKPKPDSMLRLAIHVKKVDKKTEIKAQKLTKFKRQGFTVVEWGGAIH